VGLQLTRGGEYALRAMAYLARCPEGRVCSLHDICQAQEIPESFLAKILQSLAHAGLASSQRGAHGGFALARPAAEISMRDIVEAVDGPIALNPCVLWPNECTRSAECELHKAWMHAQQQLMEILGSIKLSTLAPQPAD